MKRSILCLSMVFALASQCYAAGFVGTGTVYRLRTHDRDYGADADWVSLVGVTSLGNCKTADAGYVLMRIRDDVKGQRMFTLALTSKVSGTPLTVFVDDTVVDSLGYCYALFIQP